IVIPLLSNTNIFSIIEFLTDCLGGNKPSDITTQYVARIYISLKIGSKFYFLTSTPTNFESILDATKISDTIIYLISSLHGISIEGDYLFDLINIHCVNGNVIYSVSTISPFKINGYLHEMHLSPNDLVYGSSLETFQFEQY
ncbi:unnamed protein product, partial [Rotaria sp. Silwood2]